MFEDNANLGRDDEFKNDRRINDKDIKPDNNSKISDLDETLEEKNTTDNSTDNFKKSNTTDFAKSELNSEKKMTEEEKKEKQARVEEAKEKFKRMAGAEYNSNAKKDDFDYEAPELDKCKKKGIINPKFKKLVAIISGIFGITLALLFFSSMFGGKDEVKEEAKVEDVMKEETLSKDDLKQMQDNSSGVSGQETSFAVQQEQANNENQNPNERLQNNNTGENNTEGEVGENADLQKQYDNIDEQEQASLKALEEMEKQANSDSYNTGENTDYAKEVEKPRKNRNSIKIEGADNGIAIFKGQMNDRMQYVEAKLQKDSALNQMGVSTKNGGKSNGTGGRVSGGINIDYQANETDKVASEIFGTDPTGVKINGKIGGSGGMKTNRTPYYAYEKEEGLYDIFEGTIIPAVITNEINSDYPGRVTAIVREDVYDSLTGNFLLIPKGSKVMGDMLPINANGGVEKVATVWDRIILTNGDNIFMDNFRGQDLSGIDGIEGKVNKRYFKKISSIVASSVFEGTLGILSTLPEILLRKYDKRDGVVYSESGGRAGDRMGQSLTQIVDGEVQKVVTRPNTVTIKSGTKTNIVVNVDIRLPKFERIKNSK